MTTGQSRIEKHRSKINQPSETIGAGAGQKNDDDDDDDDDNDNDLTGCSSAMHNLVQSSLHTTKILCDRTKNKPVFSFDW